MKKLLPLMAAGCGLLASCSSVTSKSSQEDYVAFKKREDYRQTMEVYRNEKVFKKAKSEKSHVRIDLSDQRAQLVVGEEVAIDTPVCTGKAGKRTPTGTFPIQEKIVNKRSNIFGSLYRNGRKVYGGDRRKYRGRYDRYVGAPLPYWMRMTGGGIGMHASNSVHRHPRSNGCVRMPKEAVSAIYSVVEKGTPVKVQY